jgi:hypothetical protein
MPLGNTVAHTSQFSKLQRLDIGGAVILTSSLCLFILGLTSEYGRYWALSFLMLIILLILKCSRWNYRWMDEREFLGPLPPRSRAFRRILGVGKVPARRESLVANQPHAGPKLDPPVFYCVSLHVFMRKVAYSHSVAKCKRLILVLSDSAVSLLSSGGRPSVSRQSVWSTGQI